MADPPHIAVPVPINMHNFPGMPSRRPRIYALHKAQPIVTSVTVRECKPVCTIRPSGRLNPNAMIDPCNNCCEAKRTPGWHRSGTPCFQRHNMPSSMPITALPIKGSRWPARVAIALRPSTRNKPGVMSDSSLMAGFSLVGFGWNNLIVYWNIIKITFSTVIHRKNR